MSMIKRIAYILLGILLVAQLIQPDRSVPTSGSATDMLATTQAPPDIQAWVRGACYDCHSYETVYPWYAHVTPFNFWLQDHINEGREVLNYSRWDTYAGTKAARESGEETAEGEMPPANYTWMHAHARLTDAQRQQVVNWFNALPGGKGGEQVGGEVEGAEGHERD
jgi:uncharacterized membrane protein